MVKKIISFLKWLAVAFILLVCIKAFMFFIPEKPIISEEPQTKNEVYNEVQFEVRTRSVDGVRMSCKATVYLDSSVSINDFYAQNKTGSFDSLKVAFENCMTSYLKNFKSTEIINIDSLRP
jgi:hypothetical protein